MADLGSILLRRGTTEERKSFVPLKGEIIYDTELQQVFVGDGVTYGGRSVFNDKILVDQEGTLKVGKNLALITDDDGDINSVRMPGGGYIDRPDPTVGALRYNDKDKTLEYSNGVNWAFINTTTVSQNVQEIYVSIDGTDSRRYGRQRGKSWGTALRTVNAACRLAEDIVNANPETEPYVNEEQPYRRVQVLVHIASGIYEEHLPIRVPPNTSIFGAGQRRCTIRPKAGSVSESPWARIRFWRETEDYPDGYFGHHYLTDARDGFSEPKDNTDIDIFLCNDTNWFHDFGTDLHNSFAFVLDPEGQILTKSPYPHTGVCFAKSSYATEPYEVGFHGGMFADGFTGNQDFFATNIAADGSSMVGTNFWREPNMPTAFYNNGIRYQADSVEAPDDQRDNAVYLLNVNKGFIQDQTIEYVNDTYLFEYDETKCRRDLGLVLGGISFDLVLDTNYRSRVNALAYARPNSAYLLREQKTETVGALNFAKGETNTILTSDTSLQTKNISFFNDVIDVIQNGENAADSLYWPTTVYDDNRDSARAFLGLNEEFIISEMLSWMTLQIREGIAPFTDTYSFDQAKCRRDTRFLLQALQYDLMFDGNSASSDIAKSYWLGLESQIPGQQEQHVAAFEFIKTLLSPVMKSVDININDRYQLDVGQVLSDIPKCDDAIIQRAKDLITIIQEVIENGVNYLPLEEAPNLTALYQRTPPAFQEGLQAKLNLRTSYVQGIKTVIDDTITFINDTYSSFVYSEDTCRRDVGLIIDAMVHDLTYGGHAQTMFAAETYFEINGQTVIANQEAETVDAINYARDLAIDVINNREPDNVYAYDADDSTASTQVINEAYTAEAGTEAIITELFGYITNVISNLSDLKAAHKLIEDNKLWIQDEVIAFINTTYPDFVYNEAVCKRDTGYIVSAISNDIFGGSRKSVEAGRSYYGNVSSVGDPSRAIGEQLTETLAANAYARTLITDHVLANNAPSITYQSDSSQTFNNQITVSSEIINQADVNFGYILDIMENGLDQGPQALPKYKVNLNTSTPLPQSLEDKQITMITAGNKSFVATDWTMFGNLGYGVLARNNARCELVSIFTYYCGYTYRAESGSEIRSLNGSSSNGIYALGAKGRNPFEIPVETTTVNETVFVATANSTEVGDNEAGDLQIVYDNAVDVDGNPAELFNVMVAEVDHGGSYGVVRYEIGSVTDTEMTIRGTAQGLVADLPDGNDITIRLLQEYEIETNEDISDLLLGAALIYDNDPDTGYRIIEINTTEDSTLRFRIRAVPSLNHVSAVVNTTANIGDQTINVNTLNYEEDEIEDRRFGYKGNIYKVTEYDKTAGTITFDTTLQDSIAADNSIKLSPAPGSTGKIFKDFSIVKAGNHDMLDVGTGAYEDSNYPRELYGPPARPKVQANEVTETAPGRVFFTTNDQDGNFRVGDYFRVNQGDGSVSFSASIALSNLDGLGFTRGVTINEFSADSDMADLSDEAVPTEQAVVNYINKRIGQDEGGNVVTSTGPGVLLRDGSATLTDDLDMDSNKLVNLATPTATTDATNKSYVDSKQFTVNSLTANVDGSVTLTTDNVNEGSTNQYYTDERVDDRVANFIIDGRGLNKIYDDDSTNSLELEVDFTEFNTDNISEGPTNLYYTSTRANADFDTRLATKSTANLSEDPSATVTSGTMYFTEGRARAALSVGQEPDGDGDGRLAYNNTTGVFVYTPPVLGGLDGTTDDITEGTTNLFYNDEYVDDRISTTIQGGSNISVTYNDSLNQLVIATISGGTGYDLSANSTDDVNEGATNLYYTEERVDDRVNALLVGGTGIQTLYSDEDGDPNVDSLTISLDFAEFTLDDIFENSDNPTNKLFTTARAREVFTVASGGGDGSLVYTEASGTFTYTGPSATETRAHFAGGTGVTYTESTGSFAIGQDVATTADVDFASVDIGGGYTASTGTGATIDTDGNISANGNLVIEGNLTVSGTQTTLTGTEVTINDEFLTLNADKTGDPAAEQVGITVERGDGANVSLKWDDSVDNWQITNDGSTYYRILTTNDEGTGNGLDSDTLDGNEGTHYLNYNNFTNKPVNLSDFTNDIVNDTTITFAAGTDLNIGEETKTITTNQSGAQTITFNHDTISRTDTSDTASPAFAGTFDIVDSITTSNGHITAINVKTITLPSEANDLSSVVTWADVPDTNITESSVTQHQDALSIGESQITFTSSFIEAGDLSVGADAAASGSGGLGYNDSTGVFTYTPPDLSLTLSDVLGNGNTANANINPDLTGNNRQLGSTSAIWNKIYVTNLSAGSNSSSGTIEGDWTLTSGSTLEATYADLAEIYETDIEYPTGTIVMFGGDKEVTAASEYATTKVAGVISNAYAFLMNKESSGQPIALKGRIPVRVIGNVNRGDFIVASDTPGVGVATDRFIGGAVIGKAITNKTADGEGLVECQV